MLNINGAETTVFAVQSSIAAETTQIHAETTVMKPIIGAANAATNSTSLSGRINLLQKEVTAIAIDCASAVAETTAIKADTEDLQARIGALADATDSTSIYGRTNLIHKETTGVAINVTALQSDSTLTNRSLYARTGTIPYLAAGIDVTPSATAWKLGAAANLITTGAITTAYQLTGLSVESVGTTAGLIQFVLYEGTAASTIVASVRANVSTAQGHGPGVFERVSIPLNTPLIAANKVVKIKCAANVTTVPVPNVSVKYKVV